MCDRGWCFSAPTYIHTYTPPHLHTYVRIYVYTYLGDARSIVHEDQVSLSPPMCRMARQCLHMSGLVECSPCRSNKDMLQQEPSNARRRLNPLRCCAGDLNVAAPGKWLVDHHTKKRLHRCRPVQYKHHLAAHWGRTVTFSGWKKSVLGLAHRFSLLRTGPPLLDLVQCDHPQVSGLKPNLLALPVAAGGGPCARSLKCWGKWAQSQDLGQELWANV